MGHYVRLFLKGMAMGAADVVPGVSGGTIAFISGIYQELIDAIRALNLAALRTLMRGEFAQVWAQINGNFLLVLVAGIVSSIASLAHLISYLLAQYPLLIWSFFFGLIIASAIYIYRGQRFSSWQEWLAMAVGSDCALAVAFAPALQLEPSLPVIFGAGVVAICAMILPGVSGSFMLLIMGLYPSVIGAVVDVNLAVLATFAAGCVCGLLSFSRFLSWLLHHYYATTLALLTGFLVGSLAVVWPWKRALTTAVDRHGAELVLRSELLTPWEYGNVIGDPRWATALAMMACGLALVFALEYIGVRKDKN